MKRTIILVALPVLLLVAWLASSSEVDSPTARIDIEARDVRGVRNQIVGKLTEAGASTRSETFDGSDDSSAELTFMVPVASLESALSMLHATTTVQSEEVDFAGSYTDAKSVAGGLDSLNGCVERATGHVASESISSASSSLEECKLQLDRVMARVKAAPDLSEPVLLTVNIAKRGNTNLPLIGVTILIVAALAIGAYVMLRSMRDEHVIDVRHHRSAHDELYERRN